MPKQFGRSFFLEICDFSAELEDNLAGHNKNRGYEGGVKFPVSATVP